MKDNELTPQQKEFCRLLALGKSKTEAYIKSGIQQEGSKRRSACACAINLLKNVNIRTYYEGLKARLQTVDDKLEKDFAEKAKEVDDGFDIGEWFKGVVTGEITVDGVAASMGERIQAGKVYAQIKGLMTNKTEVSGDIVIDVVFDDE